MTSLITIDLAKFIKSNRDSINFLRVQLKVKYQDHDENQLVNMRTKFPTHPHHMTLESPWPILTSGSVLSMLSSAAIWFNGLQNAEVLLVMGLLSTVIAISLWWADVVKESTLLGLHTKVVSSSHGLGFSLFVVTEFIVFASIFWAYFHSSLSPTVELGTQWPPAGVTALSPLTVPLLNTVLLVSSGATVTYAHHAFFLKNRVGALRGIILTVALAAVFTALQAFEYDVAPFSIHDGAYGACFYASTGTHGLHVIVGTLFLCVALVRAVLYHFTSERHTGLESSILYWHFVDVV